ncbi:hypothetical protein JTB14_019966 [Gonioctena quinquepunctata]|nr:hypothetical protein JTB14_019966 [Gonioctena quinquepunctata]
MRKCVYPHHPLNKYTNEEIDVKTEHISREFAEQTIVTPSEESKQDEIPAIVEPVPEEKGKAKELTSEATAIASAVATGAAIAAVASATKDEDQKKPSALAAKNQLLQRALQLLQNLL